MSWRPEGSRFRDSYGAVLHQPRWERSSGIAEARAGAREEAAAGAEGKAGRQGLTVSDGTQEKPRASRGRCGPRSTRPQPAERERSAADRLLSEKYAQVVRPQDYGEKSLPECQPKEADGEQPSHDPQRADDRARVARSTRNLHFVCHLATSPLRPTLLTLRFRPSNLLPSHVSRVILSTFAQRRDVFDFVAGTALRIAGESFEFAFGHRIAPRACGRSARIAARGGIGGRVTCSRGVGMRTPGIV